MKQLLVFIWMLPLTAAGQLFFEAEPTFSTYAMGGVKGLQSSLISSSNIPMLAVTSFPSYYGFNGSIGYQLKKLAYGMTVNFNATGGRADYEDYSGIARIDQSLNSTSIRVFLRCKLNHTGKWPAFFSLSLDKSKTTLKEIDQITLASSSQSQTNTFEANNWGMQPSFLLRRTFGLTYVQFSVGYEIQVVNGKLYLSSNHSLYLVDQSNSPVFADWSGLRLGLAFGILSRKANPRD